MTAVGVLLRQLPLADVVRSALAIRRSGSGRVASSRRRPRRIRPPSWGPGGVGDRLGLRRRETPEASRKMLREVEHGSSSCGRVCIERIVTRARPGIEPIGFRRYQITLHRRPTPVARCRRRLAKGELTPCHNSVVCCLVNVTLEAGCVEHRERFEGTEYDSSDIADTASIPQTITCQSAIGAWCAVLLIRRIVLKRKTPHLPSSAGGACYRSRSETAIALLHATSRHGSCTRSLVPFTLRVAAEFAHRHDIARDEPGCPGQSNSSLLIAQMCCHWNASIP